MQTTINRIRWTSGEELEKARIYESEEWESQRQVTEAEWQSLVHPSGDWILCGGPFDERALGKFYGAGYLVIRWVVPMSASSTVREVFEIMRARPVYHFFDGMSHTELYSSEFHSSQTYEGKLYTELPAFRVIFGT